MNTAGGWWRLLGTSRPTGLRDGVFRDRSAVFKHRARPGPTLSETAEPMGPDTLEKYD